MKAVDGRKTIIIYDNDLIGGGDFVNIITIEEIHLAVEDLLNGKLNEIHIVKRRNGDDHDSRIFDQCPYRTYCCKMEA